MKQRKLNNALCIIRKQTNKNNDKKQQAHKHKH